jgi:hypothetical protein
VCHIALARTPGIAGPWNKVSHPQRGRSGGSHPCSSENTTTKTLLTANESLQKCKYRIWNKANSSKEKVKTRLFGYDSVPELNTKNFGSSPRSVSVTHMTLSAKRFRCYGILKIDFTAELYFWTEWRLNVTQFLGLRLAEPPEVLNTTTVGKPLSFPMVHNMDPNS